MTSAIAPIFLLAVSVPGSDWPQFGGPNRDYRVEAAELSFNWGEAGPKVLWRTPTGPGFGGPAVYGTEVFLLDGELGETEVLRVFDLESGTELWSAVYAAKGRAQFPGPRTVPAVTKTAVFTCGAMGKIACFDRAERAIRWEDELEGTFGGRDPGFGWSSSPLLVDDLVVFSAFGAEVGLVAYDAASGEERWVTEGLGYSHSTPLLLNPLGEKSIVVLATEAEPSGRDQAAPTTVIAIDPSDGSVRWRHTLTLSRLPIPGAVQIDAERLFLTGGYRSGSTLLRLAKQEGRYGFEEVFHSERGAQVHAPLLYDGHLYLLANENWNDARNRQAEGGLVCLGLDGKEHWRTGDKPYFGRGNALLAGDHLLIQDGTNGTLRVVRPSPKGYEQIAEAQLFPPSEERDAQMWAPMALVGKRLLLRSQEELLCVQL